MERGGMCIREYIERRFVTSRSYRYDNDVPARRIENGIATSQRAEDEGGDPLSSCVESAVVNKDERYNRKLRRNGLHFGARTVALFAAFAAGVPTVQQQCVKREALSFPSHRDPDRDWPDRGRTNILIIYASAKGDSGLTEEGDRVYMMGASDDLDHPSTVYIAAHTVHPSTLILEDSCLFSHE